MRLSKFLQDTISFSSGSVKIPLKSQIDTYREKYEALIKDKQIRHDIYRIMPGNRFIVHIKIPSSSLEQFYYDVLLELTPTDRSPSLEDCEVQFFSNSPSFVYGGYAYLFYHMDINGENRKNSKAKGMMIDIFRTKIPRENLLVPGSASKLGKEAVGTEPEVRNPMGIAIPDSSIYYAIFHLLDEVSYNEVFGSRKTLTERQLFHSISDFDHLMVERKRTANKEKAAEARKRRQENEQLDKLLRKPSRLSTGIQKPKSPTRITAKGLNKPRTNSGKQGGVNRIG